MKRFDVTIEGYNPFGLKKEYCEDGAFVDADIAEKLLAALKEFINACDTAPPIELIKRIGMACEIAKKAIVKAKGES